MQNTADTYGIPLPGYHDHEQQVQRSLNYYDAREADRAERERVGEITRCSSCNETDTTVANLRNELDQQRAISAHKETILNQSARYCQKRAFKAWRTGDRRQLKRMAGLYFYFKNRCSLMQAFRTAKPHIYLADMRQGNALFGRHDNLGESWEVECTTTPTTTT